MRLHTFFALSTLGVLAFATLAGCSGAPDDAMERARTAWQAAREAGAAERAPDDWRAADDALRAAEAELSVQQRRLAPLRRYGKAEDLFEEAARLASRAGEVAAEAALRARDDAEALLTALRQEIEDSQAMLDSEKGRRLLTDPRAGAALEGLARENRSLAETLPRIGKAIEEGRYDDALQMGEAARAQAGSIQAEIYETIETGRPPRRVK